MEEIKTGRGGKRPGAGRPKGTNNKKKYSFRLSDAELIAVREVLAKMRGKLVILFVLLCFCLPCQAITLHGGVQYTQEQARQEAFKNVLKYNKMYLGTSKYYYNEMNENILQVQKFKAKFMKIIPFTWLCITYKDEPNKAFYYEKQNNKYKLVAYEITEKSNNYPIKTIKYNAVGDLMTIVLDVAPNDSYVYNKDGKLVGRWLGTKGTEYTTNTKITRELMYSAQ